MIDHPFLFGGPAPEPLISTDLPGFKLFSRGKVRDMYDLGDRLLMVASDRLSAFDVVMAEPFPGKGIVLSALSEFWLERTTDVVRNHLISTDIGDLDLPESWGSRLQGRSMLVHKAKRVDIECVVRGYLAGSGWADYRKTGMCIGHQLPAGLVESSRLPEPIFTPSTKAETGHDENISTSKMADMVGSELTEKLGDISLRLYGQAAALCEKQGIILADTKFEFGILDGSIILIDEALTPDSSRFWPADQYAPGGAQPSFDKQYVRDYLDSTGWAHEPPPPAIPAPVIERTMEKYRDAYTRIVKGSAA
ncbi:MAG: phosphoribosylaminoimidazolesuccinocarboxamide synthase [Chloroflexi bacterium]|nr:phosphoribosylaminoimidazolesuccinocarboxamide synthase [Chloroflexota bacterium]